MRENDSLAAIRLFKAANQLHAELCKLDSTNIEKWKETKLIDFINIYAKSEELRQI